MTTKPGSILLVTGENDTKLWVYPGLQRIVNCSVSDRALLVKHLALQEVGIDKLSFFNCLGSLNYVGAGRKRVHALRYHTSLIPEDSNGKEVVAFLYADLLQCRGRKICHLIDIDEDTIP